MTFPPPVPRGTSPSCRGPPSVFSLSPKEFLPPGRFNGGGPPPPTPAIHFTASERMGELISDISRGKRFYACRAAARARKREGWRSTKRETDDMKERRSKKRERGREAGQGGRKGSRFSLSEGHPLSFPAVVHHVTRALFVVPILPFVLAGRETKHLVFKSRVTQCHRTNVPGV